MPVFKRLIALLGASALVLASIAAEAATLGSIQGEVLVSRGGGGYQPVSGSIEIMPGDMVMAKPGGSAQIVYANGSTVVVQPGSVVTVAEAAVTGGLGSHTLLIGGVVVAGGVALAVILNKDKPASP